MLADGTRIFCFSACGCVLYMCVCCLLAITSEKYILSQLVLRLMILLMNHFTKKTTKIMHWMLL